jgi:hypothetical protein
MIEIQIEQAEDYSAVESLIDYNQKRESLAIIALAVLLTKQKQGIGST